MDLDHFFSPPPKIQVIGISEDGDKIIVQCKRCGALNRIPIEILQNVCCPHCEAGEPTGVRFGVGYERMG